MTEDSIQLWPEDQLQDAPASSSEPDCALAVILLASGCTHSFVRERCSFPTVRAVNLFARDEETRREVEAVAGDRVRRIGKRAMARLERILSEDHADLRATVLAVRTGLELSGDLKREAQAPVKSVRELTVPELNALIDSTRAELNQRVSRRGADGVTRPGLSVEKSKGYEPQHTDSESVKRSRPAADPPLP